MSTDREASTTPASAKTPRPAKKAAPKATAAKKTTPAKTPLKAKTSPPPKAPAKASPAKTTAAKTTAAPSEKTLKQSKPWKRARKRAEGVLNDPERMKQIAQEAADKSQRRTAGPLSQVLDQVSALIRLVVAYARGNYREVSTQTMITIVAGLIYFVSPVDLIPDFLPGGLVDDAVVLGWVIRTVKEELAAFIEWELGAEA